MDHWQTGKKNKFDRVLNLLNFFPHLWNKTKRYWLGVSKFDENWRIVPEYRIVRESYLIWGKLILVICSLPSLGSTRRRLEVRIRTHPGVLTDMWVKSTTTHTRTTEGRWVLNWGEPEVKDPEILVFVSTVQPPTVKIVGYQVPVRRPRRDGDDGVQVKRIRKKDFRVVLLLRSSPPDERWSNK